MMENSYILDFFKSCLGMLIIIFIFFVPVAVISGAVILAACLTDRLIILLGLLLTVPINVYIFNKLQNTKLFDKAIELLTNGQM